VDIVEALVITGLGVGVVFSGLILTSLLISSFTFFPSLIQWFKKPKPEATVIAPVETAVISPPADPETAAVIAVLLEVEFRLKLPLLEGRFTFRK
jgi:Na+-transporting methylmalonyl-CoA/oxaloacetate decarboxylase gamma subunit